MSQRPVQQKSSQTPFQVLKTQVYPVINQIILKLIDKIVKSEQVQKHEQRLKKKKIIDELQRKYIQRDIQKQEMGSDYQQPDDQPYHNMLGMNKDNVQKLIRNRIEKHKINPTYVDHQFEENAFQPMVFIIEELKKIYQERELGK